MCGQCRLSAWVHWAVAGGPTSIGPHVNLYMLRTACFLMFNTDFVGSTNTIIIYLILSTIYIFIPLSGCVGWGPSALFCPGPIMLLRRLCVWDQSLVDKRRFQDMWCQSRVDKRRLQDVWDQSPVDKRRFQDV